MTQARRSPRRILADVLIVVGVALLLVAGGTWLYGRWRYHEQDVETERLQAFVTLDGDESDGEDQDAHEGSGAGDEADERAPKVDWAGLEAINDDVVGWLEIPGTVVNYPVYQSSDNTYYLRHNAEGASTVGGQVFLDCDNTAPGLQDQQSLLYGHHLRNGAMFYAIAQMDDQSLFDQTDTVWYVTEDEAYELEPLFLYYTNPDDTTLRTFSFDSDEGFHEYLEERLDRAKTRRADAERIVAGTHHVLTLSTCNYYDGYGRTELVCVPKDEARAALGGTA